LQRNVAPCPAPASYLTVRGPNRLTDQRHNSLDTPVIPITKDEILKGLPYGSG
jgi:hypothetical protein